MPKVSAFEIDGGGEDEKKYGEPVKFDPNFKGPIEKRGCTDIICCLLFLAFLAGWGIIAGFAYMNGQPDRLLYPTDSQGRICGKHAGLESKKFLFFFDLIVCARMGIANVVDGCPTPQVCVEGCPNQTLAYVNDLVTGEATRLKFKPFCVPGVSDTELTQNFMNLVDNDKCPRYIVKSNDYFGRCIPSYAEDALAGLSELAGELQSSNLTNDIGDGSSFVAAYLNAQQIGERLFQDFTVSWWMMIIALVISMLVAFVWIVLMRWIAGVMVWISVVVVIALFTFGAYFSFTKYVELKDQEGADEFKFTTELSSYLELRDTWLAFGIICAVVLLIVLLMVIFLRARIKIAIELIKEGSKAVGCMMSTLFFPLIIFLLQIIVFAWWGTVALYIASSGKATYDVQGVPANCSCGAIQNSTECVPEEFTNTISNLSSACCQEAECIFKQYGGDPNLFRAQIYNLFGLFWGMAFVVALGQMSLAGAFASYYWTFNKPGDVPFFAVSKSLWRSIRYHLGTLAFGSLLIAIVKIIRVLLEYIDSKLKGSENPVAKFFLKCLKCCFWCLEKFLKFLNKNAYIYCAIYGTNFCSSAKSAFMLIMRNIVRVFVLDKVTDFLFLISKLVVVGATVIPSFYFFSNKINELHPVIFVSVVPQLNYYWVPILVVTIGAFVIASGFFNVYTMAVDTLFLCFLEDSERNDGTPEKPYFMSKSLMKILDKKNKFDTKAADTTATRHK